MSFILCEGCNTPIGESKEGDVREGFCNWCKEFYEEVDSNE